MTRSQMYVYAFGGPKAEGSAKMKSLLGGKGANLAEMTNIGVPVPAGFTISTEVCRHFTENHQNYPVGLEKLVTDNIHRVEHIMERKFAADKGVPLLFSCRSGAPISMPGMMDTVLDLGLNDKNVLSYAEATGDPTFAWDCYRRLVQMYSNVVLGLEHGLLEHDLTEYKALVGKKLDVEMNAEDWQAVVERFRTTLQTHLGHFIPQDPHEQLWGAIRAVFLSWNNTRARTYRRLHDIPDNLGTAVNVQAMVFGNMSDNSATGVAFSRNPATGEREVYGEFLIHAQGEDIVAGIRTPSPVNEISRSGDNKEPSLEKTMPGLYQEFKTVINRLEVHYHDVQDVEFTIEEGKLWMLQTRSGKRSGRAAIEIALDMLKEGLIDEKTALLRVDPRDHINEMLHPRIDPTADRSHSLVRGLAASPGSAVGQIVFDADTAEARAKKGDKVLLVRHETSAEDIHGMAAAVGILTATGGLTSHAAVVARSMGKPCVSGVSEIHFSKDKKSIHIGETVLAENDWVTIDGATGQVFAGKLPLVKADIGGRFAEFMAMADKYRRLGVRANADTPADARRAVELGAQGIGLCRTEHMFFETEERLTAMRAGIFAVSDVEQNAAFERLLPIQQQDFEEILEAMDGLPVTIRLLDPPLHEFIPSKANELASFAAALGIPLDRVNHRIEELHESNPMLGHRGCRLGITHPNLYGMQVRAIVRAAIARKRAGGNPIPEIMIPLVAHLGELHFLRLRSEAIIKEELEAAGLDFHIHIGTMIEIPRAALVADRIATDAEFFSFGTNDLTQMTFGISRDDTAHFLPQYMEMGVLTHDPFETIDINGVGQLMQMATEKGRATRPGMSVGICGEQGGEPKSVAFCHKIGLTYVSCSPFRVPNARLAAAQAAITQD